MNILICGVGGRMGREVAKLALDGVRGATVVAGFDVLPVDTREFVTYTDWDAITEKIDCIIDFSHHTATEALLNFAIKNKIPAVIATTGHTDEEKEKILAAAKEIPVFHSANMSLGIALLVELAKTTAKAFPDADIEIVEKHHNRKLDAPSGTAITLGEGIIENLDRKSSWILGDVVNPDGSITKGKAAAEDELRINAIRRDEVPGIHSISYTSDADTITITHDAKNRSGFALGAVLAAEYLQEHSGFLGMKDLFDF